MPPVYADSVVFCFLEGLMVVVVVDGRRLLFLTMMVWVDVDERVLGPARALTSNSESYKIRNIFFGLWVMEWLVFTTNSEPELSPSS